jgi:hypothetical protein
MEWEPSILAQSNQIHQGVCSRMILNSSYVINNTIITGNLHGY